MRCKAVAVPMWCSVATETIASNDSGRKRVGEEVPDHVVDVGGSCVLAGEIDDHGVEVDPGHLLGVPDKLTRKLALTATDIQHVLTPSRQRANDDRVVVQVVVPPVRHGHRSLQSAVLFPASNHVSWQRRNRVRLQ